jgi:hypothetical protein
LQASALLLDVSNAVDRGMDPLVTAARTATIIEPRRPVLAPYTAEASMKRLLASVLTVLLFGELAFPATTTAHAQQQPDNSTAPSRFVVPAHVFTDATQSPAAPKSSSTGRRLIRNMLIGASVGAALGLLMGSAGDCGACGAERAKGVLGGAMDGAMFGAAIRIHPSRRLVVTRRNTLTEPRS